MNGVQPSDLRRFLGRLEKDPAQLPVLMELAKRAKVEAERNAPELTGAYKDSFVIEIEEGKVVLGNTDFKAHWIEWGTAKHPPFAPLLLAVHSIGVRRVE